MAALDPVAQQLIDEGKASGEPNAHLLTVDAARDKFERTFAALEKPEILSTKDLQIPTRDGDTIAARLYLPTESVESDLIVYFHGGGWLLGSIDSHDVTTRTLANVTGLAVLSINYRRPPEHRFPTAVDDCIDAVVWAAEPGNINDVQVDRLVLAGDSAGGNLAAAVANELRGSSVHICHQLLAYPVTTTDLSRGFDMDYDGIMLEYDEMVWHQENYLAELSEGNDPRVSVLNADLEGAPSATVILAQCDPIRPQGELYAKALEDAGVEVEVREYKGMIHGFFGLGELFKASDEAMEYATERIREALK